MSFMITVLLIFLLLNVYVLFRLKKHINNFINNKYINILYFLILIVCIFFIVFSGVKGNIFGTVFSWYMAVFIYALLLFILSDIILLIFRKINRKIFSSIVFVILAGVLLCGIINAYTIDITTYDTIISKEMNSLRVVLISDTHYGSNEGINIAKQMTDKINAQNPDIVLYTGDVFDGSYEWVSNPDEIAETLSHIKSKYGVYACWGNHDVYGGNTPEMYEFLKKANIKLLEDSSELVNNEFYVVGRLDSESSDGYVKSIDELISGLDKSKPVIVMDHRPKDLRQCADAGVDILLSGHTHKGQTFPGNIFINKFWDNAYGIKEFGNMKSIVTSGVGLWGPPIRLGTDSEIVVININ